MFYPLAMGTYLGLYQTGLFFQLTLTLSSGFSTYLLVTLCWLAGSILGVLVVAAWSISLRLLLVLSLLVYGLVAALLRSMPYDASIWFIYVPLLVAAGILPGVFFSRLGQIQTARGLFLWENNGFIVGMIMSTLLFMAVGRVGLWLMLLALGLCVLLLDHHYSLPRPAFKKPMIVSPD